MFRRSYRRTPLKLPYNFAQRGTLSPSAFIDTLPTDDSTGVGVADETFVEPAAAVSSKTRVSLKLEYQHRLSLPSQRFQIGAKRLSRNPAGS